MASYNQLAARPPENPHEAELNDELLCLTAQVTAYKEDYYEEKKKKTLLQTELRESQRQVDQLRGQVEILQKKNEELNRELATLRPHAPASELSVGSDVHPIPLYN